VNKAEGCTTAVILAGGEGQRVGRVGALLPKGLLPVSQEGTLISHLIDQLRTCKPERIVISTSPENHSIYSSFLKKYVRLNEEECCSIQLLRNDKHQHGPIAALGAVVERYQSDRYVIALSDVHLTPNPFNKLAPQTRNSLIVSKHKPNSGGVVLCRGKKVVRLCYHPLHMDDKAEYLICSWSGSLLISHEALPYLLDCAKCSRSCDPLENWINAAISAEIDFNWIMIENFINVNKWEDFRRCINRPTRNPAQSLNRKP